MGGYYDAPHIVPCAMSQITKKYRFWACILYPDDGLREDFLEVIDSWHMNVCLSPLHSPDSAPQVDEAELAPEVRLKRHYHLVLMFDGPTTQSNVIEILSSLGPQVTTPFYIRQIYGYIRYLIHLDNPEKEQFSGPDEITTFVKANDFCLTAFEVGEFDKVKLTRQINQFIISEGVTEYEDLLIYSYNNEPQWAYLLDKCCPQSVKSLLASRRWRGRYGNLVRAASES